MFSFFKKKSPPPSPAPAPLEAPAPVSAPAAVPGGGGLIGTALVTPIAIPAADAVAPERQRWLGKLQAGLRKTGASISTVFTGSRIDDALYEDLETALLMADTGVKATEHLLDEVRRRVKEGGMTHPVAVKNALVEAVAQLLKPLEKALVIGQFQPTVRSEERRVGKECRL